MKNKKSCNTTQKNKKIWQKNLVQFQQCHKKRGYVATIETSLAEKNRMPLKMHIIGRYIFIGEKIKSRKERIVVISNEIINLWDEKLNFPRVSEQSVRTKVEKVLKTYDECTKRQKFDTLNNVLDVTKQNGVWLSSEDKKLYELQLNSNGDVGYSTSKYAHKKQFIPLRE